MKLEEPVRKYVRLSAYQLQMAQKYKIVIYRFISPSGKRYIGQTRNLHKRLIKYKNLNCECQPLLYNSFKKYGYENHNFKIMETYSSDVGQDKINADEIKYINIYKAFSCRMLNLREGGGSKGKMSTESRAKMSIARMGKVPWNKGIKTGLIPKNKGTQSSKRSYTYFMNGEEIVILDLKRFCIKNNLIYSAMIEIQSENGNTGKRGEYKGYTKTIDWTPPILNRKTAENHPRAMFTNNQILLFRERYNNGERVVLLAKEYSCNEETMRNIVRLRTYKSVK